MRAAAAAGTLERDECLDSRGGAVEEEEEEEEEGLGGWRRRGNRRC